MSATATRLVHASRVAAVRPTFYGSIELKSIVKTSRGVLGDAVDSMLAVQQHVTDIDVVVSFDRDASLSRVAVRSIRRTCATLPTSSRR